MLRFQIGNSMLDTSSVVGKFLSETLFKHFPQYQKKYFVITDILVYTSTLVHMYVPVSAEKAVTRKFAMYIEVLKFRELCMLAIKLQPTYLDEATFKSEITILY